MRGVYLHAGRSPCRISARSEHFHFSVEIFSKCRFSKHRIGHKIFSRAPTRYSFGVVFICTQGSLRSESQLDRSTFIFRSKFFPSVASPNTDSGIKSFCLHLRDCRFAWSLSARRAVSLPNFSSIRALSFFGPNFFCVAFPNTESRIKSFCLHLRDCRFAWSLSARRAVSVPNFSSIRALSFFGPNFF